MSECKLPLDAKNTVWRVKPNSQTAITEQGFDVKVQYYHWISAWPGGAGTCFSWKLVFLCLWLLIRFSSGGGKEIASKNCRRFGHFLNTSSSQSEAIARTSPRVNQADVPLDPSVTAIFLRLFFCPQIEKYLKQFSSGWLRHADLAAAYYIFHAASPSLRPFDREAVHHSSASHLRFTGRPPVFVLGGFPIKHRRGGSNGQRRWRRPNETQAAALNSYNKDSGPFKEDRGPGKTLLLHSWNFLILSNRKSFYLRQEDKLMLTLLPSVGHYFLREGFLTNV